MATAKTTNKAKPEDKAETKVETKPATKKEFLGNYKLVQLVKAMPNLTIANPDKLAMESYTFVFGQATKVSSKDFDLIMKGNESIFKEIDESQEDIEIVSQDSQVNQDKLDSQE